ncbi:uncharacterized protein LOC128491569 [Spea bombifrons]|uniref:uncharacterized protein LOC128491569 n=1 Tax=Spea bombifrons TaxID=233779 RepID=UPI00234BCEF2|nr:uncharacterized protein LOC128491569 [Spea bombifrons]
MVGKPKELRTASIRIQELGKKDGPMFCCRVELVNTENKTEKQWQNRHGTFLRFSDEIWVDQLEVIHALPGEQVTIPCYIHYPPGTDKGAGQVTWRKGNSLVCSDNTQIETRTNVSLYLESVKPSENSHYCCEIKIGRSTYTSALSTQLSVEDYTSGPEFTILQPAESSASIGNPVTISCSIKYPPEKKPLWTGVYWKVGSIRGDYSYHPSQSMVHSRYRGRTELRGQMDLHIQGVQDSDNDTFYCLAILRFCNGTNIFNTKIIHGKGTRLRVTRDIREARYTEIIAPLCALLIVIILCVILIFLKRRGVICTKHSTKEDVGRPAPPDNPPRAQTQSEYDYANELPSASQTGQVDSGGVLYAQFNIIPLNKGKTGNHTKEDPQVLYAAVRPTR